MSTGEYTELTAAALPSFMQDAQRAHAAFVDLQLSQLEPGQTLCVHEVTSTDMLSVSWPTHVLAPGEECDHPQRRQQYGPAPANWRTVVAEQLNPARDRRGDVS